MDNKRVVYLAIINAKNEPIFCRSFGQNRENDQEYQVMAYSSLDFVESSLLDKF
jgi:hypothetical protein